MTITECNLLEKKVTIFWTVLSGDPSSLSLFHFQGNKDHVLIADNIPPYQGVLVVEIHFDLDADNHFELLAYEYGCSEPTGGTVSGGYPVLKAQGDSFTA